MKKKLLLGVLPALMVLSACNGAGFKVEGRDSFKETTTACQDIFGRAEIAGELKGRRNSSAGDLLKPVIGVQYKEQGDGRYAVRFIAAIASLNVKAHWFRAVTGIDNSKAKDLNVEGIESTTAYETLQAGLETIEPEDFAKSDDYKYFITYSMYNIPSSHFASYMIGYVTLSDDAETPTLPSVTSDAKVTQIQEGGDYFQFENPTVEHYLLGGKLGGKQHVIVNADNPKRSNKESDAATFSYDFLAGDTFVAIKHNPADDTQKFRVSGYSSLGGTHPFIEAVGLIRTNSNVTKTLYLNHSNEIYVSDAYDITFTYDLDGQSDFEKVGLAGNFNGWNTSYVMDHIGGTSYSTTIQNLPSGYWAYFKCILDDDWSTGDAANRLVVADSNKSVSYKFNLYTIKADLKGWLDSGAVIYAYQDVNSGTWTPYDSVNQSFSDLVGGYTVQLVRFKSGTVTPSWDAGARWNLSEGIGIAPGTLTFTSWSGGSDGKSTFSFVEP